MNEKKTQPTPYVEIMNRDELLPPGDLAKLATVIARHTNAFVAALGPDDIRSMVYWGVSDVDRLLAEYDEGMPKLVDNSWKSSFLDAFEVEVHQAMLDAGWDTLRAALDDELDDYFVEMYGVHLDTFLEDETVGDPDLPR